VEAAAAGSEQDICGLLDAVLAGNAPTIGTGTWTHVGGTGTGTISFLDDNVATTTASSTDYGTYVLRWTVENVNAGCSTSSDVEIWFESVPDLLGEDDTICNNTLTNIDLSTTTVPRYGVRYTWTVNDPSGQITGEANSIGNGNSIDQPIYSFVTHNRVNDILKTFPKKVVIIEGILIYTNKTLRDLIDIKVFVHADSDERLIRRLRRDISERGRDLTEVLERYQSTLKPMHEEFIEPTKNFADLIIPNDSYNTVAINIVRTVINERLVKDDA